MKVQEIKTIRRVGRILLPVDKALEALIAVAEAQGIEVPDVPLEIRTPKYGYDAPEVNGERCRVWLEFNQFIESKSETEIR